VTSESNTQFNSVESRRKPPLCWDKGKHLGFNRFNTFNTTSTCGTIIEETDTSRRGRIASDRLRAHNNKVHHLEENKEK
jgi:hypothetical protein